jgi:uncharacterized protein involved in exopolysaccharide biosynthesis
MTSTDETLDRPLPSYAEEHPDGGHFAAARRPPPHPLGPLRPVVSRWWLVLPVTLAFAAGGAYVGNDAQPTYSASSTINVGRTDVRVQALPGYAAGATSLAAAYARIVQSAEIEEPLARRLRLPVDEVHRRLSAVPVPSNPFFTISGTGRTADEAVRFTRAATREIQAYVKRSDRGDVSVDALLSRYRSVARRQAALQRRIDSLTADAVGSAVPASAARAQAQYDTLAIQAEALKQQYAERSAEVATTAGITVISPATTAESDRNKTIQRLVAVGLVAGLVVGSALALLLEGARRARRRRRGLPAW